jgi:hypothetical protein
VGRQLVYPDALRVFDLGRYAGGVGGSEKGEMLLWEDLGCNGEQEDKSDQSLHDNVLSG